MELLSNRFTAQTTTGVLCGVKNTSTWVEQSPASTHPSGACEPYPGSVRESLFATAAGLALGMTVIGAALSPVVLWGLFGGPVYWFGTLLSTVTAPGLMRYRLRTRLSPLSIAVAMATGYCVALTCGRVGTFTAELLLAISRGRSWPNPAQLWPTVGLWLGSGILGILAVLFSGPSGRRSGYAAPVLWLACAPATAVLLGVLQRCGWIALSA